MAIPVWPPPRVLPHTSLRRFSAAQLSVFFLGMIVGTRFLAAQTTFDYPAASVPVQALRWQTLPPWLRLNMDLRGRTEGQTSLNQRSGNDRLYELTRLRGGVELRPANFLTGYLEFHDTHALGLPLPQVNGNMRDAFDLFEGYVDLHTGPVHLITGRQQLHYGNERVLGINDWANNSRAWDGFRGRIGNPDGKGNFVDLFSASVVKMRPTSLDKHGAGLQFHGAAAELRKLVPHTELYPFVYVQATRAVTDKLGHIGNQLETTVGGEVAGHLSRFDYDLLGDLQRGSYATTSRHAGAAIAQIAYRLPSSLPAQPRLNGQFDYATGDTGNNPARLGTYDQLYPSNHNAFGLVDVFGFQNIRQARGGLDLRPHPHLTLLFQAGVLYVATPHDAVYASNGSVLVRSPPGGFTHTDLGQEFDASGSWAIRNSLLLKLGAGHLFPGRTLAEGGKSPPLTLGYLQLTYRFQAAHDRDTPQPGQF